MNFPDRHALVPGQEGCCRSYCVTRHYIPSDGLPVIMHSTFTQNP
jgi:hypothetical protein